MTEAAFQACRVIMRKANYVRGQITRHEGIVAKWSRIEALQVQNNQKHDGTTNILEGAIKKLNDIKQKFADMKFPDNDLIDESLPAKKCVSCRCKLPAGTVGNRCDKCMD